MIPFVLKALHTPPTRFSLIWPHLRMGRALYRLCSLNICLTLMLHFVVEHSQTKICSSLISMWSCQTSNLSRGISSQNK